MRFIYFLILSNPTDITKTNDVQGRAGLVLCLADL